VADVALLADPPEDLDAPHTDDVAPSVGELDAQPEQQHDAPSTDRTEERAAAAWLETTDPEGDEQYRQLQAGADRDAAETAAAQLIQRYRNHAAGEGRTAADVQTGAANQHVEVEPVTQDVSELRPYGHLPDQVLDEDAGQLAAEHAAATRVAANAQEYLQQIQTQIAQDRGPEAAQLRAQDVDNHQRLAAMTHALQVSNAADEAEAKTAALAAKVMEVQQNLTEVRGAFAGRRRTELQQQLDQVTDAHQQQRAEMIDLAVRNQELTAELGTRSQQQQALALRDAESYRTQLAAQMEQARLQDAQEATAAAERAAATAQRATVAAEQLAAMAAEQAHRAEHPDPTAELHRQESMSSFKQSKPKRPDGATAAPGTLIWTFRLHRTTTTSNADAKLLTIGLDPRVASSVTASF